MGTTGTTVRSTTITVPGVRVGPDNPLPPLRPPHDLHQAELPADLPADMASRARLAPLTSLLPCRIRDGYGRDRAPLRLDALVLESERLRATVLPGLGGRLASLVHKPSGRELLYRNPVLQPANFALTGAWFSGGVEWNVGATGHTPLACAPLHAARMPAPDGGEMLRLWEWEQLRDLPFQVDLWLPADSDFLYVGVRVRNPHAHPTATYWWSNTAVPETPGTRVLAPADQAWYFGHERELRRVAAPGNSCPEDAEHASDWFYDLPGGERPWIAALDARGRGLVQTSTDALRGRKAFVWGTGGGGRRWQEWLTEPGTGGYLEIQAGLATTQLEHVPLAAGAELSWLEAYGPLEADPAAVHGADWAAARAEAAARLEDALPRADVDAAYAAWRPFADAPPKDVLAVGSGWGALEVAHGGYELPGTPFDADTLGPGTVGAAQQPWRDLLVVGGMREARPEEPPGPTLVAPHWRELLETTAPTWLTSYHLGVAAWHAGDRAQAVRAWERSLDCGVSPWALRCLAVADLAAGDTRRGADRLRQAVDMVDRVFYHAPPGTGPSAALSALAREAVEALLAADRPAQAREILDRLPPSVRSRGRLTLLHARTLLAEGDPAGAKAVFDAGFEVEDLREGETVLEDTWREITQRLPGEHPLPRRYDFRMGPG
ncbi:DUF5107 domain-containing protein [Streptomyces capparidis]